MDLLVYDLATTQMPSKPRIELVRFFLGSGENEKTTQSRQKKGS